MPTGMLAPSGFVCFVPRKAVVPVKMSIEDAAKIIISAGMVNPERRSGSRNWRIKRRPGKVAPAGAAALGRSRKLQVIPGI